MSNLRFVIPSSQLLLDYKRKPLKRPLQPICPCHFKRASILASLLGMSAALKPSGKQILLNFYKNIKKVKAI